MAIVNMTDLHLLMPAAICGGMQEIGTTVFELQVERTPPA
jgi:hypothetical protein